MLDSGGDICSSVRQLNNLETKMIDSTSSCIECLVSCAPENKTTHVSRGAKVGSEAILKEKLGGSEGRSISGLPLNGVMIFSPEKIKRRWGKQFNCALAIVRNLY